MSYDTLLADAAYESEIEEGRQRLPFYALLLFIALFFLRPWDQFPALAAIHPMIWMTFFTVGLFLRSRPHIEFLSLSPMRLFLAMQFIICMSVVFSYWPSRSFEEAIEYLKQIAFFVLIVHLVTTIERIKLFSLVMVGCCAIHGGIAILNYASGREERLEGVAGGYFGDPNDLALSIILIMPIAWWASTVTSSKLQKTAVYFCMMLMVGGVISTQSRGGLIALIASVAVMVVTQGRERIGALILTLVAAVVFAVVVLPDNVFDRYTTITHYEQDEVAR